MTSLSTENYKKCVGKFATGITVVTTQHDTQLHGITINSFNSVSLTPPLILFSIDTSSKLHNILINNNFSINILSEKQRDASQLFAQPHSVNWTDVDYIIGDNKCPLITGSCATLECTPYAHYDGGDHTIIVGEITKLDYNDDLKPLAYYASNYHKIGEILT